MMKWYYKEIKDKKQYYVKVCVGDIVCGYLTFNKEDFLWIISYLKDRITFIEQ